MGEEPSRRAESNRSGRMGGEDSATVRPGEAHDPVAAPIHYRSHPAGIECIDVVEHMSFCLGNAVKYIWRADHKDNAVEDLQKARWYLDREIQRRQQPPKTGTQGEGRRP